MTNILKVNHAERTLVMDRTFAKNADIVGSREYLLLQDARRDYPNYATVRRTIKKKETQERYNGLTYEFMREYIETYETTEKYWASMDELNQMIMLSKCHSKRYPVIKSWFLEKYPEVKKYGTKKFAVPAQLPSASAVPSTSEAIPA